VKEREGEYCVFVCVREREGEREREKERERERERGSARSDRFADGCFFPRFLLHLLHFLGNVLSLFELFSFPTPPPLKLRPLPLPTTRSDPSPAPRPETAFSSSTLKPLLDIVKPSLEASSTLSSYNPHPPLQRNPQPRGGWFTPTLILPRPPPKKTRPPCSPSSAPTIP